MIKRWIGWVVLAGVVGALVVGAVNRTLARSETGEGPSRGWRREVSDDQGWAEAADPTGGRQARGSATEAARGEAASEGQVAGMEWLTLYGRVLTVDEAALAIGLASGETIEVRGRAWSYAMDQGFDPQAGDDLELEGFYDEQGSLELAVITDVATGWSVPLREAGGRPLWAGGRAGGRGGTGRGSGHA